MWKKGNKVNYKNRNFDSEKEFLFYQRFCEKYDNDSDGKFIVKVHPSYDIVDKFELEPGLNVRGAKYTPDVVIADRQGDLLHVYDVKNGFTAYAIDAAAKLRFKLFTERYKVPVECVVIRKNNFKVKIFGTTKQTKIHTFGGIDYDWRKAL